MLNGRQLSKPELQIDALDGIRGIAILIVFLSHTSYRKSFLFPYADFSGTGASGVYLFFVLSSFLLTYAFITKDGATPWRYFLRNYFARRFLRIFPLYFFYLLIGLTISLVLHNVIGINKPVGFPCSMSINDFIDHILLKEGKGVPWVIPVEFGYYLVLPVLAVTYSVLFRNRLAPCVFLTLGLILAGQVLWPQHERLMNDPRLGPYLPIFLMGSLLAVIHYHWQRHSISAKKKLMWVFEGLATGACAAVIILIPSLSAYIAGARIPSHHYNNQIIVFGFLWCVVLFGVLNGEGGLRKLFENPFLRYCGFISFSLYLWHYIVIDALRFLLPDIQWRGWLMFIASIGVSYLTWITIEKPISRIRVSKREV